MTKATTATITLSPAEYEALKAQAAVPGTRPSVTVDAAEYAAALDAQARLRAVQAELDRANGRLRDLETALRREQQEHQDEYSALLERFKKTRGG